MKRIFLMLLAVMLVLSLALAAVACGDGGSDNPGGDSTPGDGGGDNPGGDNNPGDGGGDNPGGDNNPGDGGSDTPGGDNTPGDGGGDTPGGDNNPGDGGNDTPGGDNNPGDGGDGNDENDLPQFPLPDEGDEPEEGGDASDNGGVELPVIPIPKPGNNTALAPYNLLMQLVKPSKVTISGEGIAENGEEYIESGAIEYNSDGTVSFDYTIRHYDELGEPGFENTVTAEISAEGVIDCSDDDQLRLVEGYLAIADTDSFDFTLCDSYTESDSVVSMTFDSEVSLDAIGISVPVDFAVNLAKDCSLIMISYENESLAYSITLTYL